MRAFLIKYLVGRYWYRIPGQKHFNNTSRGPFWYYNGFLLIALLWIATGRPEWLILWPTIGWSLIVLYFGFPLGGLAYFEKFPFQWYELDEEQKWQYGQAAMSGELSRKLPFDDQMMMQWYRINQQMKKKYNLN